MIAGLAGCHVVARAEPNYTTNRAQMIRTIETQARDLSSAIGRDHIDPRVLDVMGTIPRHDFVPENLRQVSYEDRPLPIGFGQTISQPLIVALMTDVLNINPSSSVLVCHRSTDPPDMKPVALSSDRWRRGWQFYGAIEPAY